MSRFVSIVLLCLTLCACGGGGGSSVSPSGGGGTISGGTTGNTTGGGATTSSGCVHNIAMSDSSSDPNVKVYAYDNNTTSMQVDAQFTFTGAPNGGLNWCGNLAQISSGGGQTTWRGSYSTSGTVSNSGNGCSFSLVETGQIQVTVNTASPATADVQITGTSSGTASGSTQYNTCTVNSDPIDYNDTVAYPSY